MKVKAHFKKATVYNAHIPPKIADKIVSKNIV